MMAAAEQMEFERAAALRDRIMQLQESIGKALDEVDVKSYDKKARRRKQQPARPGESGGPGGKVPRPKRSL